MPKRFTPPVFARSYGVSKNKVLGWIASGELPAVNVSDGKRPRWVISEDDIAVFEARRMAVAPTPKVRRRNVLPVVKRYV